MPFGTDEYPRQRSIRPGAILGSIAHAVFVCRHPMLSYEQSWDGTNYNVQDSAGSRGTIAFAEDVFVAVFFYERSDRNPFRGNSHYNMDRLLVGLPRDLQSLAHKEALEYVLQELDGAVRPVITSAFWGDGIGERVGAAESWSLVFDHGAVLVQNQLLEADVALVKWAADYELNTTETALVGALFNRKMLDPSSSIEADEYERSLWEEIARGQDGVDASRESFAEVGIIIP